MHTYKLCAYSHIDPLQSALKKNLDSLIEEIEAATAATAASPSSSPAPKQSPAVERAPTPSAPTASDDAEEEDQSVKEKPSPKGVLKSSDPLPATVRLF
jgi:ribosomal protein L12E/L44/L45/RPP1/RPP2